MSRAFVKEDANNQPEDIPERRSSGLPNYVTLSGRTALQSRVGELAAVRKRLAGEKSEEPLEIQRLRLTERDLRYYQNRLETAILVDNSNCTADEVRFGATVSVKNEAGDLREFTVVGEDEADVPAGKISWSSPLATAVLGARPGAKARLSRASGESVLEIVSVRYLRDIISRHPPGCGRKSLGA